jgi:phospholipid N-methyltransferase
MSFCRERIEVDSDFADDLFKRYPDVFAIVKETIESMAESSENCDVSYDDAYFKLMFILRDTQHWNAILSLDLIIAAFTMLKMSEVKLV